MRGGFRRARMQRSPHTGGLGATGSNFGWSGVPSDAGCRSEHTGRASHYRPRQEMRSCKAA